MLEKNDELRAENQAAELGWLKENISLSHDLQTNSEKEAGAVVRYLVTTRNLHDHWETVVIGGRVAEGVHDGSHLLNSVQTCHWRTHHLPGQTVSDKDEILHHNKPWSGPQRTPFCRGRGAITSSLPRAH